MSVKRFITRPMQWCHQSLLAFSPGGLVTSRIGFITTGEIKLKMKPVPAPFNLLNQTTGSYQLQNNSGNLALNSP